jgi:hypothetical protein
LRKATEEFIREEIEARTTNTKGKMVEPLTDAILASILHLIRRDLIGNRRAPPHWAPPRRALALGVTDASIGKDRGR